MSSSQRARVSWRQVQPADELLRPTRAEIDLNAIAHNLNVVREAAGQAKVLAVVKADAYGHGVVPVARRLQLEGVDAFGVALAEEGLELRDAGINRAILVLNGVHGSAHRDVIAAGLTPVLYELSEAAAFNAIADDRPIDVHLKVDTGMGRLGVPFGDLDWFLEQLATYPAIRVVGVMTHFATADEDRPFVQLQLARFDHAVKVVRTHGHEPVVLHAANSAALFRHPEARLDWVRPGLALYGYAGALDVDSPLRPAMRWRTEIISIREITRGDSVGYGRTFQATEPAVVAAIPVGYGDGLFRALSNKGSVLVHGTRCPIIGNVSMDLTTIDVSALSGVEIGDEVVLMGEQGDASLGADELAAAAGTIPYEVLTNVSRRVPRLYLAG